ncbi:hypothetical protein C8J57DRAFT_1491402 [Mycena rebaudengoi]|nr:hypothetical protein C8J57DRAFT_1491402 [Mycena rebaudengoi]
MTPQGTLAAPAISFPTFNPSLGLPGSLPAPEPTSPCMVLSPLFIDNLAKEFRLTQAQRGQLHIFAQLGSVDGGLSKPDLATRLFSLGVSYQNVNAQAQSAPQNSTGDFSPLLEDLRVRLTEEYTFTKEQLCNIRAQAQDTIYESSRTSFMRMHDDVLKKLRENWVAMKLSNVFDNPAREKTLASKVNRICSSVRNSYCQDLRASICGNTVASLAAFTYTSATKFKRGGPGEELDIAFTIHNAILRRFGRENFALIGAEEVDEPMDDDSEEAPPAPKKRKLAAVTQGQGGGRVPKGKDFWSQVDTFFAAKIKLFGSKNLLSAGWKEYTNETTSMDNSLFPDSQEPTSSTSSAASSSTPSSPPSGTETEGLKAAGASSDLLQHI